MCEHIGNFNIIKLEGTIACNIVITEYAPNQCVYYGSIFGFSSLVGKFGSNPQTGAWIYPCCSNYMNILTKCKIIVKKKKKIMGRYL